MISTPSGRRWSLKAARVGLHDGVLQSLHAHALAPLDHGVGLLVGPVRPGRADAVLILLFLDVEEHTAVLVAFPLVDTQRYHIPIPCRQTAARMSRSLALYRPFLLMIGSPLDTVCVLAKVGHEM
jgi:hypothetical protein